ncbi:hypothetical protein V2H26_13755 [Xanthomonas euvesicatoria]|uniref:hypothetical protein n=1 Tax=Xanthomonas citri TaxID=346 RepID=UPI001878D79B|nr:hypothetical protein [Xanthomonas axonopodis]MEE5091089.1 hypothetical protein [Xanthomonas euvesicatoria]
MQNSYVHCHLSASIQRVAAMEQTITRECPMDVQVWRTAKSQASFQHTPASLAKE